MRDKEFVFAETHLKAFDDNVEARVTQAGIIENYFSKNIRSIPVFLAGDFNDFPWSKPVRFFENHFVDLYTISKNQDKYPANHPNVKSVYPDYTLICDTNTFGDLGDKNKKTYKHGFVDKTEPDIPKPEGPKKPAIEHRCLDYLMVMRNNYLE